MKDLLQHCPEHFKGSDVGGNNQLPTYDGSLPRDLACVDCNKNGDI